MTTRYAPSAAGSSMPRLPRSVLPRPHHPMLRRAADALQFGVMAEGAVEAADLARPLLRLLSELRGERRLDELLDRAVELGAERADAHALLHDLYAAGALIDAGVHARVLEARRAARVLVSGDGPLLVGMASGLAAAGVGTLRVMECPGSDESGGAASADDAVETAPAEASGVRASTGGAFGVASVGLNRWSAAAADAVRRAAPGVRFDTGAPRARRPDLAVLAGPLWPDPGAHAALAARGVPALVVRVTDEVGLVGPLVLPKRSACLRCGDLHRAARDPCWATVAADLAGRIGSASHATTAATAALATEQAVLVLDSLVSPGRPPPTLNGLLELDPRGGELRRRPWPPHPGCGCGAARAWSADP